MKIYCSIYFYMYIVICLEVFARDEDLGTENLDLEPRGDFDFETCVDMLTPEPDLEELSDFKESEDLQECTPYQRIAKCVTALLEPLYPGTQKSVMSVVFCLLRWSKEDTRTTLSNTKMKKLFKMMKMFMPPGNNLPTFDRAKELVYGCCGVRVQVIDSCIRGCVLFRNETSGPKRQLEKAEKCPECLTPRFNPDTKEPQSRTTILGAKGQVVARLFWNEYREEASPPPVPDEDPVIMNGIRDSPRLLHFLRSQKKSKSAFTKDLYHLFGYMTDGMATFKGHLSGHSMWPHLLKDFNLPPGLLARADLFILFGVTHGPKGPSNVRGVLLAMLEDFESLWHGVDARDSQTNKCFTVRAVLHSVAGDLPGLSKILEQNDTGSYQACPLCWLKASKLPWGTGMSYAEFRRWLPTDHPLRGGAFGMMEMREQPPPKITQNVIQAAWSLQQQQKSGASKAVRAQFVQATGIKARCHLSLYPPKNLDVELYPDGTSTVAAQESAHRQGQVSQVAVRDYMSMVQVDPYHVLKGCMDAIIQILQGNRAMAPPKKLKGENDQEFQNRRGAYQENKDAAQSLTLSEKERAEIDRVWKAVKGPVGFCRSNAKPCQWRGNMSIDDWVTFLITDVGKVVLKLMENHKDQPKREFYKMYCKLSNACQALW
jgi:hypothetical protein